jgi:hypothetical protein
VEVKINTPCVDFGKEGDEVLKRAAQPVHGPRRDDVKFLPRHALEHLVKAGALITPFGSADALVGEGRDNGPAEPVGYSLEFPKLVLDGLAVRRDSGVKGNALGHAMSVSWNWKLSTRSAEVTRALHNLVLLEDQNQAPKMAETLGWVRPIWTGVLE